MARLGKVGALGLLTGLMMSMGWMQPAAAQGSGSATLDAAKGTRPGVVRRGLERAGIFVA